MAKATKRLNVQVISTHSYKHFKKLYENWYNQDQIMHSYGLTKDYF